MPSNVVSLSQVRTASAGSVTTADAISAFLADLEQAGRSPATRQAYGSDLRLLAEHCPSVLDEVTPASLRSLFATMTHLAPSTRARRQSSAAAFFGWAYREELVDADPMGRVARVRTEPPLPRGLTPTQTAALLAAIPTSRLRDRTLFTVLATTGMRIGEALGLHVDDLTLERDDERVQVLGKGGKRRTVLLDDPELLRLLRRFLREQGYRSGPLFRAERGTTTSALTYQAVQARFAAYAATAGITGASLHDLRHGHAQALVNGGVSLSTIRKRLGHASVTTTQRYAEQADSVADAELRAWQRRQR
jgi:integrase/recombinase XerD